MKFDKQNLLLYAVTDRSWLGEKTLFQQVEEALQGGVTMLQLREKDLDEKSFMEEAAAVKELCARYQVPFLIDDNVPLALRCGADGVHVGQSAQTVSQAVLAQEAGADYLGVGAVFSTSTKLDADTVSLETLREICTAVKIPVVAIGGINEANLPELTGSGINGVAVVSAIFAAPSPGDAARRLSMLAQQAVQGVE